MHALLILFAHPIRFYTCDALVIVAPLVFIARQLRPNRQPGGDQRTPSPPSASTSTSAASRPTPRPPHAPRTAT
jgi:hypothetical protein